MDKEFLPLSAGTLFAGFLILILLLEIFVARRPPRGGATVRWFTNFGLTAINLGLGQLGVLFLGIAAAEFAEQRGLGLFNLLSAPGPVVIIAGVLLLDFVLYVQHRLFHAIPALWRFHLVHHSDPDLDVTTHFRHHPGEWLVAYLIGIVVIVSLGLPPAVPAILGLLYGFAGALQHANLLLPRRADCVLRWLLVTPNMHAVHHSSDQRETDSNFGSLLCVWDRLFDTYVESPAAGYLDMDIGIGAFTSNRELWPDRVLSQPIRWQKRDAGAMSTPTTV